MYVRKEMYRILQHNIICYIKLKIKTILISALTVLNRLKLRQKHVSNFGVKVA